MIQAGDSLSHQFPILSELMNFRSHMDGIRFGSWTFREVLDRLLAISAAPVKQTLKVNNFRIRITQVCAATSMPY